MQEHNIYEAVKLPDISTSNLEELLKINEDMRSKFVAAIKALSIANKLKDENTKRKYQGMVFANLNKIRNTLNKLDRKIEELMK